MTLGRSGAILLCVGAVGCGAAACGRDSGAPVAVPTVTLSAATTPPDPPLPPAPASPAPNARLLEGLGAFVVATPPGEGHAKGTIAALSYDSADGCAVGVAEVDLSTASEVGHLCLGSADRSLIASGERGVVVASQSATGLTVTWLDGVRAVRARHVVAGFGPKAQLTGLTVVDGRAVVVDSDAQAFVVDEQGKLIARRAASAREGRAETAPSKAWQSECRGITGDLVAQSQRILGLWLVRTTDCCGDDAPAGLFVCNPGVAP